MTKPSLILVLDDEKEIVDLLELWLVSRGHRVTAETNPLLALEALSQRSYDLVLLDLLMPNANGLTLISKIKRLQPEAAIVVVSAIIDPHLAVLAAKEGSVMCLEKPIKPGELESVLESVQHPLVQR